MMMKHILTFIFNLLLFLSATSCLEENIPRNRPDLRIDKQDISANTEDDKSAEDNQENEGAVVRPNSAIVLQPDHCECEAGQSIGLGNCVSFCANEGTSTARNLFFNIQLSALITESNLKDLAGFCSTQVGETQQNAGCILEAKDEDGNLISLPPFTPTSGQTSFQIEVAQLPLNKTVRVSIVEQASGARSTTIQVRLRDINSPNTIAGLLSFMPVSEYTCIARTPIFDEDSGALIIESANRFHFYFIDSTRPEPLRAETISRIYCHDLEKSPTVPLSSPLLEEKMGVFTLWDRSDPRFFDLDNNSSLDINDIIQRNVELQGSSLTATPNFFFPLIFPSGLDDGDSSVEDTSGTDSNTINTQRLNNSLGFAMTPFLDDRTFRSYCPSKEHYFSTNIIFEAMREVVGVGTEALYVAKQENVCDNILVNEGVVSQIWFFRESGQHIRPTPETIRGKKIQFYWPADFNSPFIKKSFQRTYTIQSVEEINSSSCGNNIDSAPQNGSGVRTTIPAHDKRIGCIPVLK